ncbi:hypothetical protein EDC94DRAFT_674237 [Helicostylum pulchrum]|nr:hypothetical protein EDC94DRAFT_674237 [Helicostylum pulchrum]
MTKINTCNTEQSAIPRPLNCFLMYRLEKQKEIVAKCAGANHRDISKIIAKWWREASEVEKRPFRERARIAKIEHRKLYPDYKYTPKKKTAPKRVYIRKNKKEQFTSREKENNKFMEMIYDDVNALESVKQTKLAANDKPKKVAKRTSRVTKKQVIDTITAEESIYKKYEAKEFDQDFYRPSCRYSVTTPEFGSQATSPFTECYSDSDFSSPQIGYSPYETTMSYTASPAEAISPYSVLDTPYINDFNAFPTMPYFDQIDYFHFEHSANNNHKVNQEFSWTEYPDFCSTQQYQNTINMYSESEQLQYINPALLHM